MARQLFYCRTGLFVDGILCRSFSCTCSTRRQVVGLHGVLSTWNYSFISKFQILFDIPPRF
jgi:hypothetical protein